MKHTLYRLSVPLGIAALCFGLTGCGGGGGGGSSSGDAGTIVSPPDPSTPVGAFMAYVIKLVGSTQDNVEPASVVAFDPPPVSNTSEPVSTR
jgi:hypothetical protein